MQGKKSLSRTSKSPALSTVLILFSLIAFFGITAFVVLALWQERRELTQELFNEKQGLADLVARTLLLPGENGDFFLAQGAAQALMREAGSSRDVAFLHMIDVRVGSVVMANREEDVGQLSPYSSYFNRLGSPRIIDGEYRGENLKILLRPAARGNAIVVGFSLERIDRQVRSVALRNILFGALMLMFIWAILVLLFQRLIRPLQSLEQILIQLRKGDQNAWVDPESMFGRELKSLAETLNTAVFALRNTKEREKVVTRAKSEFITLVAHQLRTPLSATKWALRMVLDGDAGKITKEQYELLNKGYISNERMVRLISDLLDVVRIEEGRFGYEMGEYALEKIVREVWNDFQLVAGEKSINFVFDEPRDSLPLVTMDPARIRLVLENLFKNAISYTEKGGEVRVSIERSDGELQVAVSDNGIGISKNQAPRIFTKFYRAANAVAMETEGTGLGLYIAKNVVERHGGRIWFESLAERGSTFYFTIPLAGNHVGEKGKI